MTLKKPDRFERAVEKIIKSDRDVGYDAFCFPNDVITLLRNEHAWMRRMVKGEMVSGETGTEGDIGYNQACLDILSNSHNGESKVSDGI